MITNEIGDVSLCESILTKFADAESVSSWWRREMETFSALLAICVGNSPVTDEFPTQRPVTRSFDVFVDPHLCKRLSKQSRGWWFETLWRHCNGDACGLEEVDEIGVNNFVDHRVDTGGVPLVCWQIGNEAMHHLCAGNTCEILLQNRHYLFVLSNIDIVDVFRLGKNSYIFLYSFLCWWYVCMIFDNGLSLNRRLSINLTNDLI